MSLYTNGPWRVMPMKNTAGYSVWSGQPGGTDEYRVCGVGLTHISGQAEANALLIAAAPELLEALEAIVNWNSRPMDSGMPTPLGITKRQLDDARAAIAKASVETA